jgi:hypothetical protein
LGNTLFTLTGNISALTRQFILDGIVLLSDKEITQLHQSLIQTLAQKSTTPVAHLALDMVSRNNLFAIWTEICTPNLTRMPNKSLQTIAAQVPKFKAVIQ